MKSIKGIIALFIVSCVFAGTSAKAATYSFSMTLPPLQAITTSVAIIIHGGGTQALHTNSMGKASEARLKVYGVQAFSPWRDMQVNVTTNFTDSLSTQQGSFQAQFRTKAIQLTNSSWNGVWIYN